jgi:DnaJ-class molecular chaperone
VEFCPYCWVTTMQIRVHQIGPGMVRQIQSVCVACQGHREWISPTGRYKRCSGKKRGREKILEVHIDQGIEYGQKTTFHCKGDQEPGMELVRYYHCIKSNGSCCFHLRRGRTFHVYRCTPGWKANFHYWQLNHSNHLSSRPDHQSWRNQRCAKWKHAN